MSTKQKEVLLAMAMGAALGAILSGGYPAMGAIVGAFFVGVVISLMD